MYNSHLAFVNVTSPDCPKDGAVVARQVGLLVLLDGEVPSILSPLPHSANH